MSGKPLTVLTTPPPGLFTTPARQLVEKLPGPTLLYLPGKKDPPLFVSVLLHGNETSGWTALSKLLADTQELPRSLIVFIGNIDAAAQGVRCLPGQPDYNRIWRGAPGFEGQMVDEVLSRLQAQTLFAAVDIHNNTGRNPHYSVLTDLTPQTLGLAYLFSDKAVYVEEPATVMSRALGLYCAATTVEVGPLGDTQSDDRTHELLSRYLALERVPAENPPALKLYRSIGRVHIPTDVEFDFADEVPAGRELFEDLILTGGMEAVNFHPLAPEVEFALTRRPLKKSLCVLDPNHQDVTDQFFDEHHGLVTLRRSVIPAMYTTDHAVIRQDCLCYFMEEMSHPDLQ